MYICIYIYVFHEFIYVYTCILHICVQELADTKVRLSIFRSIANWVFVSFGLTPREKSHLWHPKNGVWKWACTSNHSHVSCGRRWTLMNQWTNLGSNVNSVWHSPEARRTLCLKWLQQHWPRAAPTSAISWALDAPAQPLSAWNRSAPKDERDSDSKRHRDAPGPRFQSPRFPDTATEHAPTPLHGDPSRCRRNGLGRLGRWWGWPWWKSGAEGSGARCSTEPAPGTTKGTGNQRLFGGFRGTVSKNRRALKGKSIWKYLKYQWVNPKHLVEEKNSEDVYSRSCPRMLLNMCHGC